MKKEKYLGLICSYWR